MLEEGLLAIDFRDHASLATDICAVSRAERGWQRIVDGWRKLPRVGVSVKQQTVGVWCVCELVHSKKRSGLSQDFHNGIKAERGGWRIKLWQNSS